MSEDYRGELRDVRDAQNNPSYPFSRGDYITKVCVPVPCCVQFNVWCLFDGLFASGVAAMFNTRCPGLSGIYLHFIRFLFFVYDSAHGYAACSVSLIRPSMRWTCRKALPSFPIHGGDVVEGSMAAMTIAIAVVCNDV